MKIVSKILLLFLVRYVLSWFSSGTASSSASSSSSRSSIDEKCFHVIHCNDCLGFISFIEVLNKKTQSRLVCFIRFGSFSFCRIIWKRTYLLHQIQIYFVPTTKLLKLVFVSVWDNSNAKLIFFEFTTVRLTR
jgi:hypothetical protein